MLEFNNQCLAIFKFGENSKLGLGTIANSGAIVVGALCGVMLKKGLPQRWQETMMQAIAFCIVIIGVQMALKTTNIVITIFSLVIGAIIGESIDIEELMRGFSLWVGNKVARSESVAAEIAKGFVNASILFCTGAMAIVGSIQDGLAGDYTTLFAKATLDGLISLIMAANLGIGVALSAVSVAVYQGSITLMAGAIEGMLSQQILAELTAAGGIMIMAIGTNMLELTKVRIANLLPGIIVSVVLAKYIL